MVSLLHPDVIRTQPQSMTRRIQEEEKYEDNDKGKYEETLVDKIYLLFSICFVGFR